MIRSAVAFVVLLAIFVAAAAFAGSFLGRVWYAQPPEWTRCGDILPDDDGFDDCVNDAADLVGAFDYPEFKDLAKTFLAFASATLVASLAFAAKLVEPLRAPRRALLMLFIGWSLLVASIAASIVGIAFMASAAFAAQDAVPGNLFAIELRATRCLFFAASSYVLALVALVLAGATSTLRRRAITA